MIDEPFDWEREQRRPIVDSVPQIGQWTTVFDDTNQSVTSAGPNRDGDVVTTQRPYSNIELTRRAPQVLAAQQVQTVEELRSKVATLESADGSRQITISVDDPTGDAPDAAIWWKIDATTGVVDGTWVGEGGAWVPTTFGDEVLDSLTAGKITSGSLSVGTMIVVGDPNGSHAVLAWDGLHLKADPDGSGVREVAQMGTSTSNVWSVFGPSTDGGETMPVLAQATTDGTLVGQSLTVANDIFVGGKSLFDLLAPLSHAVIGRSWGSGASLPDVGQTNYGIVRMQWALEEQRRYKFVGNVKVQGTPGDVIEFNLHYRAANELANISSPVATTWFYEIPVGGVGSVHLEHLIAHDYSHENFSLLLAMRNWATSSRPVRLWNDAGSVRSQSHFWLEDCGIGGDRALIEYTAAGGQPFVGTTVPTAPTPTKRTYVKTYTAQAVASWRGGSLTSQDLQHGVHDGVRRYSQILFPDQVRTDLAGATLKSARIKLRNIHTYYGAGMTAYLSSWSHQTIQSAPVTAGTSQTSSWKAGESKFVPIPWSNGTQSAWLGVGAPSGHQEFGRFSRALSDCMLELTYEK